MLQLWWQIHPGTPRNAKQFLLILTDDEPTVEEEPPGYSAILTTEIVEPTSSFEPNPSELMHFQLSQAAFLGTPSPRTLRVQGKIKEMNVTILVDSGSSHNIIQPLPHSRWWWAMGRPFNVLAAAWMCPCFYQINYSMCLSLFFKYMVLIWCLEYNGFNLLVPSFLITPIHQYIFPTIASLSPLQFLLLHPLELLFLSFVDLCSLIQFLHSTLWPSHIKKHNLHPTLKHCLRHYHFGPYPCQFDSKFCHCF